MTLEGAIRAAAKRGELIRDPQATLDELVQLRAEVRALRKDRDRLDYVDAAVASVSGGITYRQMIDAAMSARSGEDK